MPIMRLFHVLLATCARAELCESDRQTAAGAGLLQRHAKGVLFPSLTQEEELDERLAGHSGKKITQLACGVRMKLNASFSLDAVCPSECPMHADPSSNSKVEFCFTECVGAHECAARNPEAPVADRSLGACRGPVVPGCDRAKLDGTDSCVKCDAFHQLRDGKCALKYWRTAYAAVALLVLLSSLIGAILSDLMLRPVSNESNLEDGLAYRSKQKFRQADLDGSGRPLYPLSTNLCTTIVGGPGLALHFRFQAMIVCWAALIAISWVLLALLTDYDMLILGTKEFGTAFRNCVLVAWGKETQRRLMWIKVHFVAVVYVCSFLGAMAFGVLQLRFYQHLDERNDTMKDYAARITCLPTVEGSDLIEGDLKDCLEAASSQKVVGVSVCWSYAEHKDVIHREMMQSLHKPTHGGLHSTHFQQPVEEKGFFREQLFGLEQRLLSEADEEMSDAELMQLVTSFKSSSTAFAVFPTEHARDEAVRLLFGGVAFRETTLQVSAAVHEPHGVKWDNIDGSNVSRKLWRLARGCASILLCLTLWMAIFYAPYAWSILQFNYEGGRQPGIVYTLAFSFIVVVGNLLMAEICGRVADAVSFEFKDTRENCYMILYLLAISVNVGLDLWTTYFMATQIVVGMDFRTETGILLADVDGFVEKFNSYALQRSMGQQLIEYSWPSTFILPFLVEPFFVIFLFSRIFMLIVGSHPELKVWECRTWLVAIDLELGRYADCLVNVYLATMVFFFPGGYTHWIFFYLAISHIYIYAYDHYRVLRVVPRATFSSMTIDFCAQALLAPACAIVLVAAIFKGNCLKGSYCLPPMDLFMACLGAFLAHCGLHLLLLRLFVPLFGKENSFYRKDARSYRDVATSEPCSWFSANPIHCLRSKYVFKDSPPCTYFIAGLEDKIQVNHSIGCYFKENADLVEDVQTYYMPKWRDVSNFLKKGSGLFADEPEGDTGATGST